jgi:osmotically-inducible protein OsmY
MKRPASWTLAGAALLIWSTAAFGQTTSSGSIGGGSRIGASGTGGTSSGGGYSLSGGTANTGLGMGSSSATGTTGATSLGGIGGTVGTLSSTTSTGISNMDLFYSHYANPMYSGRVSSTGQTTTGQVGGFGAPLYTLTTTSAQPGITGTLSATGQGLGGLGGLAPSGRRGPAYTCVLVFPYDPPTPSRLQTELQQVIARSSGLTAKDTIKVKLDGQVLVLEGTVPNDRERRLAEGLLRLTPGVRQIRNNLFVGTKSGS